MALEQRKIETSQVPVWVLSKWFDKDMIKARDEVKKCIGLLLLLGWNDNQKPN